MNEDQELNDDDRAYLDNLAAETEIEQHQHDPLDAELTVHLQAFTIERLRRYLEDEGLELNQVVNDALASFLYGEGE